MKTRSNSVHDIRQYILKELSHKYSQGETEAFIRILFQTYADIDTVHLLADENQTVNESSLLSIVIATQELKKYRPIQYIVGKTCFCDLEIELDQSVLIPRPETEELCYKIIKENSSVKGARIMDLGCGSGCIALALKKHLPSCKVFAVDFSKDALSVAKNNAKRLGLEVNFLLADMMTDLDSKLEQEPCFDILVSNPPYVTSSEKQAMSDNVLKYEPASALFVPDEKPLVFYEKIADLANRMLKRKGRLYLEINEKFGERTLGLFPEKEYVGKVEKDLFGKDRFVVLEKNS